MLYEPPKTKQYLIIGAAVVFLAILIAFGLSLAYKNKKVQTPVDNTANQEKLQQEKIQKEFDKLETMRKSTNAKEPTQEDIQKEFDALEKQRAESGATPPTQEQIQAEFDKLEKMKK